MTPPKPLTDWQARNTPGRLPRHVRRNIGEGPGGCWLWLRSTSPDGYGWASLNNRTYQAHRLIYVLLVGEPPKGLILDHLCRIRNCVNPQHLEPVTARENLRRSELTPTGMIVCAKGHELSQWYGQRRCVICKREYDRAWRRVA